MQKIAPCKGCSSRHVGCHGSCSKYQNWSSEHIKENKQRYLNMMPEVYIASRSAKGSAMKAMHRKRKGK